MTEPAAEDGTEARPVPFISRVRIKNYKSIASCDVRLGPLTILVGPNGSGKSNFLDALAFVARALETTPDQAIDERGGLFEILRRVPRLARSFSIGVETVVPWWPGKPEFSATYEFEIGPTRKEPGFEVIREEGMLRVKGLETWRLEAAHGAGGFRGPNESTGVFDNSDRFLLPSVRGGFKQLYDGLRRPRFYNFNPETLRIPQPSATRPVLRHSGEGLGEVLAALSAENPYFKSRIDAYMGAIVQDATGIDAHHAGGYVTVSLLTSVNDHVAQFNPLSMSDGTIRAAAVLSALFQPESLDGRIPLIGIEEPELALHPAAAGVLFDALTEASEHVQVIATSQSADLLDREDLDVFAIRPVTTRDGLTVIDEVDDVSREIVRQKLYTLGELMRANQLSPAPSDGSGPEA